MIRTRSLGLLVVTLSTAAALSAADLTQIRIPRLPKGIPKEVPRVDRLPSVGDLLGRQPLTSSLDDAVTEVPFLDRFDPKSGSPLLELPFGLDDGVTLVPGVWNALIQSYCLKAGTYGPTRGDGYLWAPLKGPKADVINAILNRSARHPDVPQHDIQVLLWGIIARTRVSQLGEGPRAAAAKLLDESQIGSIDGSALDVIPDDWMRRITGPIEGPVRRALEAENRLRQAFANPGAAAYDELERIAVLNGVPAVSERGREVPARRWSYHPDGYFIRFMPNSYTNTELQLYVPERFTASRDSAGLLTALRDAAGSKLTIEYAAGGAAIAKATFTPAGGVPHAMTIDAATGRGSERARDAIDTAAKLAGKDREGQPRAKDVAEVAELAVAISDPQASSFLLRAWASAVADLAHGPAVSAALAFERAQFLSASTGALFARPMPMSRPFGQVSMGGGWGGGSGGSGGGGGGGGMPGGGRQRLGPSLRKFGDDNSIDKARNAIDKFGKAKNGLDLATDPAGLLGGGIPDALFGKILDFNFDTWEKAAGALAGDPPRPDFREFSKPEVEQMPSVKPSATLPAARAERLNALGRDLANANAYLKAAGIALDRHGGAVEAGDRLWAGRQAHALIYLKREAGILSLKVADDLEGIAPGSADTSRRELIDGLRELGAHFASLPAVGAPWDQ